MFFGSRCPRIEPIVQLDGAEALQRDLVSQCGMLRLLRDGWGAAFVSLSKNATTGIKQSYGLSDFCLSGCVSNLQKKEGVEKTIGAKAAACALWSCLSRRTWLNKRNAMLKKT